jgi:SAM-dependent methyltransferase/uncharacterized protein YbaR (Trm112 family)
LPLSAAIRERLQCPYCAGKLLDVQGQLQCDQRACGRVFPLVDGTPVLINEHRSLFSADDFVKGRDTTSRRDRRTIDQMADAVMEWLPSISHRAGADRNYESFRTLLRTDGERRAQVLVVGGGVLGAGMDTLASDRSINLISTDVTFGSMTELICDAHDIPFADATFDGVIAQAVLEHVVDPYRCVSEIHRVMRPGAIVYAETPFMQQVHLGAYDFHRFTHSGHRRLFRQFAEIESGPVGGPGMALAWSYQYFLLSFSASRPTRALLRTIASLSSFYLKYFDRFLVNRRGAIDAAAGYYFLGSKNGAALRDRDLVPYYRGALAR